jgi:lipopolysaccharide biosynthesis regulator YciM
MVMGANDILIILSVIVLVIIIVAIVSTKQSRGKRQRGDLYTKGLNYMLHGEHEAAIECFKEIVNQNTENVDAYLKLGILYRNLAKLKTAISIHKALLYRQELSPDQKQVVLRNLVEDYLAAGEKDKALQAAEQIITTDRRNIWALSKIHILHRDLKHWEQAAEFYEKVLHLEKRKDDRQLALYKVQEGLQKMAGGQNHDARLIFRKALKIDPNCEAACYYIADSYIKDNRQEDALEWWEKYAEITPDKAKLIFQPLKKVLFNLGNFGIIEQFYQNILEQKPSDPEVMLELAGFYERKGDFGQAYSIIMELLEKLPDNLAVQIALSRILLGQNKIKAAVDLLSEILEKTRFGQERTCSVCQSKTREITWLCPNCGEKDTLFN